MKFKDKVVWITGASSGLGKYMAYEFAKEGAQLALSARRVDKLEKLKEEIISKGGKAETFQCDVQDDQSISDTVEQVIKTFGQLDVAIANAGFGVVGKIKNINSEEWKRQFDINVVGLAMTAKYAIPQLIKTQGRLVLIGSVAAYVPNPGVGAYGASKAAVRSIGQTLQIELKGSGVSCTVIHPGFVDSDIAKVDNQGVLHPDNPDPRPKQLMWPTDKAAKVMVRAIHKRRKSYVFTGHGKIIAFIGQHFPGLAEALFSKMKF